jgi:hypothetical protein
MTLAWPVHTLAGITHYLTMVQLTGIHQPIIKVITPKSKEFNGKLTGKSLLLLLVLLLLVLLLLVLLLLVITLLIITLLAMITFPVAIPFASIVLIG